MLNNNISEQTSVEESNIELSAKLSKTVELYEQNKISKENVWNMEAIDLFQRLTSNKSTENHDYRFISKCIEAVTKIYILRLDSLYVQVVRMSSFLGRKGKNSD